MSNILMIARPASYISPLPPGPSFKTRHMPLKQFYRSGNLFTDYEETLWKTFHTRSAYSEIIMKIDTVVFALDELGRYAGSALVSEFDRERWLVEYVMTRPEDEHRGIGSAVMNHVMSQAQERGITWVQLKCNPNKNNGQLPKFYAKFGFKKVEG